MDPKLALFYAAGPALGAVLGGLAVALGWLRPRAGLAAMFVGALAWWAGGLGTAAALLLFVALGSLAARGNPRSRDRRGRGPAQVLANGLPAGLGGVLLGPLFFYGAVAAALADTLASELGGRAPWAWRPGRGRVPSGTNAAVSLPGTLALLLGAALVALPFGGEHRGAVFAAGVFGAVLDTLTGPLEERLGWWTNDVNNAVATAAAGLLALVLTL
ncbi:DUF92 domain-containing protein [Oceanithermus desulfurans]|uniref:DUF92 domain-containing protein n=2 Tax=Oceanithermus desulfurans TaxID=227924 RepID=A0A511RJE3_9DEIN|nr:DUF92 domain-containing protein [Oceanithermus desulfurans]MBB6029808.1 uncharacterized protein (TIGR00297 family) [Oceanithermus desulfurans]GEM89769.1 hypothetical protein ODE01S_12030 [Oceanithermus desulfurans NBRC 100063]